MNPGKGICTSGWISTVRRVHFIRFMMGREKARNFFKFYFFEFVEISFTLEIPKFGHVLGHRERLRWLPVFDETTFIGRDHTVVLIAVLHERRMRQKSPLTSEEQNLQSGYGQENDARCRSFLVVCRRRVRRTGG